MMLAPLLVTALMIAMGQDASPPDVTPIPERCIVHYDRSHTMCGILLTSDDTQITVQDDAGHTHVLKAERVVGIEPLLHLPVPAAGIIQLRDGRQLEGLIRRDDCDTVEIVMHGVPLEVSRHTVARVWLEEPIEVRYARLKQSMPVERAGAHLALCQWLMEEKAWDLAIEELQAHVAMHRSVEAQRMLRLANSHHKLHQDTLRKPKNTPDASTPTRPSGPAPVDDAAVNLVRVYEIDLNQPPNIEISPETRASFLEAYKTSSLLPDDRTQLMEGDPLDVLRLMFAHRAREFYGQVRVIDEPIALRRFRQSVHDQWLVPGCASTDCHGGPDGGRFRLLTSRKMNDRIRTSNLLILDELVIDGRPLVNWQTPEKSLLIQHALPLDQASDPHPAVDGWKPQLGSTARQTQKMTEKWITSMLREPRPDYPVSAPEFAPTSSPTGPRLPR